MIHFKPNKRHVAGFLFIILLIPGVVAASDTTYQFTNVAVPTSDDQDYYTENLWEVTDEGVYNDKGEKVESAPASPSADATLSTSGSSVSKSTNTNDLYQASVSKGVDLKKAAGQEDLTQKKQNLQEQQNRFQQLADQIANTEEKLGPIREQELQLKEQIDLINSQIRITEQKITNVEVMIAQKQIQIKKALIELQQAEAELEVQKKVVLDYVNLLYQEEAKFFDLYDGGSSDLKLLLSDQTVAENLVGKDYLSVMEETGRKVFDDLNKTRQNLAERQVKILKEQQDLQYLNQQLNDEKRTYEDSLVGKNRLLEETQGQEDKYNQLLEASRKQQEEAAMAVQSLQSNIANIEAALRTLDGKSPSGSITVTPEMLAMLADGPAPYGKPLAWPVPPNKITAEFHDPSYPAKWGYHNAIDIRQPQYTQIHAPANAYVAKVADNGMGYSYIILAHKNGLSTVYGHVSQIMVKAGQTVKKGDVIGLTGGTPGTKGAGLQTTGAHLHFETHLNGTPVDPLNFLPVSELSAEYVPAKHLADLKTEAAAQQSATHEQ